MPFWGGKTEEYIIKVSKGHDTFFDAAKQAMQKLDSTQPRNVSVILECHQKGRRKSHFYNTYFVLLSAGMSAEADALRCRFQQEFGIDLAKEPVMA